jgi:hypothetical protein
MFAATRNSSCAAITTPLRLIKNIIGTGIEYNFNVTSVGWQGLGLLLHWYQNQKRRKL